MQRKLNVSFLAHPIESLSTPWSTDVIEAVEKRHDLSIMDQDQPAEAQLQDVEVIVDLGGNISDEMTRAAGAAGVKFIQAQTNGLDHVNLDAIRSAGIMLAHCPGELSSVALAESAMMFILMLANRWGESEQNFAKGKIFYPTGMELVGRKLAIVGFGASGQQLARRARPFGMQIMAIDIRDIEQDVLDEIQPEFLGGPDDLDGVVAECDFLSVHLHLTEETHHTIDARRIGLMKPTAHIINVARGALIDEEALYESLREGRIGGAGLDVFAQEPPDFTRPVFQLPNVLATPHVGGSSDGTSRKRAQFAADNLDRYARGEPILGRVL